jgi:hypothetical protein
VQEIGYSPRSQIDGCCPTTVWQPGDYIVDRFDARIDDGEARRNPAGMYRIWTGLVTGAAPRWTDMPVSDTVSDMYDPQSGPDRDRDPRVRSSGTAL